MCNLIYVLKCKTLIIQKSNCEFYKVYSTQVYIVSCVYNSIRKKKKKIHIFCIKQTFHHHRLINLKNPMMSV